MKFASDVEIAEALERAAQYVAGAGAHYALVVIGGAALNLIGIVRRPTSDVDVLAFAGSERSGDLLALFEPPDPMPSPLAEAVEIVAQAMNLDPHWLNTGPALQWQQGLPPGLNSRVTWRHYGPVTEPPSGLDIGLVDRYDLVLFKVYAAADHATTRSVHYKDLLVLAPTPQELGEAATWVKALNASPEFYTVVDDLVAHVGRQLGHV